MTRGFQYWKKKQPGSELKLQFSALLHQSEVQGRASWTPKANGSFLTSYQRERERERVRVRLRLRLGFLQLRAKGCVARQREDSRLDCGVTVEENFGGIESIEYEVDQGRDLEEESQKGIITLKEAQIQAFVVLELPSTASSTTYGRPSGGRCTGTRQVWDEQWRGRRKTMNSGGERRLGQN
ncbi:hypothetical protein CRG98_042095 [Punica granatum]|uniref:Uncharacterized protein n=1 Tax=Punica granatum TaxID=22663 RepID=A0A2I0I217_PUNGR|nr:hypothetical protein CRG98_042095 [Punica granatum]